MFMAPLYPRVALRCHALHGRAPLHPGLHDRPPLPGLFSSVNFVVDNEFGFMVCNVMQNPHIKVFSWYYLRSECPQGIVS